MIVSSIHENHKVLLKLKVNNLKKMQLPLIMIININKLIFYQILMAPWNPPMVTSLRTPGLEKGQFSFYPVFRFTSTIPNEKLVDKFSLECYCPYIGHKLNKTYLELRMGLVSIIFPPFSLLSFWFFLPYLQGGLSSIGYQRWSCKQFSRADVWTALL